jgi:N-acetyl-anhydromuramyl-L-alanine amidase AmpD
MIKNIIVHHTASNNNYTLEMCNQNHKDRFGMKSSLGYYVGYHYFIDPQGKVTQTRVDTEEGAHCRGWNNTAGNSPDRMSIGISMVGNFSVALPTDAQVKALTKLLNDKVKEYNIDPSKIVPHRKYASTECYGKLLSDTWASELVTKETKPSTKDETILEIRKKIGEIEYLLTKI